MFWKSWSKFTKALSGEWMLKNKDNGGSLILLRSIYISVILFSLSIAVYEITHPDTVWEPCLKSLISAIHENLTWFGVFFGGVYVSLYSRFASQWSYLSNLYNSIKQASCVENCKEDALAEWKAGFIEDAECLHLAYKKNFVPIIHVWLSNDLVKEKYIKYAPGGKAACEKLETKITKRMEEIESKKKLNKENHASTNPSG